jgi:SpoVK/Ycf46/Vps4 family AAA+-type ATPase
MSFGESTEDTSSKALPAGLTLEKPGSNIASLSMTASLRAIMATVIRQWQSPQAFRPLAKYGIYPVRQMLFHGPPGNGKTSACQWIAQRLSVPLYRVRCETLVGSYLGQTAKQVAAVMEWLKTSPPSIVLFDEVESLFPSRSDGGGTCAREMSSAMTVFWQYLDRWSGQHLFVLATNMRNKLDPALLSRLEMQLEFGPPTTDQAREVIAYWSEVLHAYGAPEWSAELIAALDDGHEVESFRELWQAIQKRVTAHVTKSLDGGAA